MENNKRRREMALELASIIKTLEMADLYPPYPSTKDDILDKLKKIKERIKK